MTTDATVKVQNHALHSRQYLENALAILQSGEAGKAGELLWGCVTQAAQAVAAARNRDVKTHRDLKNFVLQLARDLADETIRKDFLVAESLHSNFYAIGQEPQDIAIVVPDVQRLVTRLLDLIPPELREQQPVR